MPRGIPNKKNAAPAKKTAPKNVKKGALNALDAAMLSPTPEQLALGRLHSSANILAILTETYNAVKTSGANALRTQIETEMTACVDLITKSRKEAVGLTDSEQPKEQAPVTEVVEETAPEVTTKPYAPILPS
jgi:hypothetical protein